VLARPDVPPCSARVGEPRADRVAALTGLRGLAVLLVVATHSAFGTGQLTHGDLGLMYARLEIGVQIFFVLSGFLLFAPWVRAAAAGTRAPLLGDFARRRARRVLPAYTVTVLLAYLVFHFYRDGPNPAQTWLGLFRHLTLTQTYTENYLITFAHRGLTQTWSLAVEAAFYAALPALAYLLLVLLCRNRWRPGLLLAALGGLAAVSPVWLVVAHATDLLPNSAGMWLPAHLVHFACGMALAVLREMGMRLRATVALPAALVGYLVVSTPIAGEVSLAPVPLSVPLAKTLLYALIATLVVAPVALGGRGRYARLLSSRWLVWLGEISYEIFLLHVTVMSIAMGVVLGWPVFTGSMTGLIVTTLAITVPLAVLLRVLTQPRPELPRDAGVDRVGLASWPTSPAAGR